MGFKNRLLQLLSLPDRPVAADLDHPASVLFHSRVLETKPLLKKIYIDFYREARAFLQPEYGHIIVEIGSGAGFAREIITPVFTSDILMVPRVDLYFDALRMPFADSAVDGFFMIDALHHIPDVEQLLREVGRCLKPGGKLIAIEPANTFLSRFIYSRFHHEVFNPAGGWSFADHGPLSSANGALPWIVFCRDRARLQAGFPSLSLSGIRLHTPLLYILSGGLSMRQLVPDSSYACIRFLERVLAPLNKMSAMFMTITLHKHRH